jgi:protocatechuate 3,4-dioxygenase beta subunit
MPDDAPVGRLLSRRQAVALLATTGALSVSRGWAATEGSSPCVVLPEQTEGPFFVDEQLERSDLRFEPETRAVKAGAPLALAFTVSQLAGRRCVPLAGAQVDVWHCDALGEYSLDDRRFLRGYQRTDAGGHARFLTIFPGWYSGRAVHIHFKIRAPGDREFASQLYFDDGLIDRVHATEPYRSRGQRSRRNRDDGIFRRGGEQLMPIVRSTRDGYAASFAVALAT